jgi:putative membrane protein
MEARMGFLVRVAVNALAIMLAASILPGIGVDGIVSALAAAVLLGLVNAFVRPVLLILTLPITLLTLGLFLFVLNGLCFWLVASVVKGFHVAGFGSAMLGALVVSAVSWILTALISDSGKVVVITRSPPG